MLFVTPPPIPVEETSTTKLGTSRESICFMDITRFIQKPNTPVPIPPNASAEEEKDIIAGNVGISQLSAKKKERLTA